jgi:hypothetical protein
MKNPSPVKTWFLSTDDVVAIVRRLGMAECLRAMADANGQLGTRRTACRAVQKYC